MADAVLPAPSARPARRRSTGLGVAAALLVLAVALAIGSGLGSSGHPTDAQRAAALEADIRCPSCDDLSVAQSAASSAIAVRHEVSRLVADGESNQQIESSLVDQYGSSILLRPPTSGLTALVWFVPAAGGVVALCAVAALFWRRSVALRRLRVEQQ
jgi:cytochrome c-type biogenesis protein CcmH